MKPLGLRRTAIYPRLRDYQDKGLEISRVFNFRAVQALRLRNMMVYKWLIGDSCEC